MYPKTPTYTSWDAMKARCLRPSNPRYARYGGRGIAIHEPWLTFANFLADMGERPEGTTLDRVDNDGNYEPSNCRWADAKTQARGPREKTHCKRGHPLSGDNLYVKPSSGKRGCKTCAHDLLEAGRQAKRDAKRSGATS